MNIKILADYHTHTIFSDGTGTIAENVASAVAQGIKTIGITDHGFYHVAHGIRRKRVAEMRAEVERLKTQYPDTEILLGIEANLVNMRGEIDMQDSDFALFDYCIFGIHKVVFSLAKPSSIWFTIANFFIRHSARRKQKITDSYIAAINKYPVKIVVHPNYAANVDVARLAVAAKEKGVWIECNGKRTSFSAADIAGLRESEVGLVLSSDAHSPERVGEVSEPIAFLEQNPDLISQVVNIKVED